MTEIEVRSSTGITLVPVETVLMRSRRLFIEDEINSESACDFIKKLMVLCSDDKENPIDVFISSPGGEISAGLLIYDTIQSIKSIPIRMFCMGSAYSMAAVIFASGNNGRYMLPHSKLMLHEPLIGDRIGGNCSSIKSVSDSLIETKKKINQLLAYHTGKSIEKIDEATKYDHYFNTEESIAFGLADKVIGFDSIMEGVL